jgi:carbon storage regulator
MVGILRSLGIGYSVYRIRTTDPTRDHGTLSSGSWHRSRIGVFVLGSRRDLRTSLSPFGHSIIDHDHGGDSMLVLSRKIDESIIIGGSIRVTITAIRGRQVRVSIDAPEDITIVRDELLRVPVTGLAKAVIRRRSSLSRFPVLPDDA